MENKTYEDLKTISFQDIADELKVRAPTFWKLLTVMIGAAKKSKQNLEPVLAFISSQILFKRNQLLLCDKTFSVL